MLNDMVRSTGEIDNRAEGQEARFALGTRAYGEWWY